LLLPSLSFASLNVSIVEEPQIYRAIDQLISLRLIDKVILGHKPWSRSEAARLIKEAQENISRIEDVEVEVEARRVLKYLSREFKKELEEDFSFKLSPFSKINLEYLFLDSPFRKVAPVSTGGGDQIDAFINPLVSHQLGRNFADTHNGFMETRHEIELGRYFSIAGNTTFLARTGKQTSDEVNLRFDELYLRSEFKNIGVQFGRDILAWGQGSLGGLIHSTNATPLDMFKISNIHPFYYPWIFKHLGPSQISFYFSVLEESRDRPHPYMVGYKFSFRPLKNFEFGFTNAILSGGEGGSPASAGQRLADVFGFLGNGFGSDPNISNRVGGFDFALRIPPLRGAKLYYEVLFEDLLPPGHWNTMFLDEAIHQAGILFGRLNKTGTQSLRLEYQHSGYRPYRHAQYTSGWTRNEKIMGSELGPDADGLLIEFESQPTFDFAQRHSIAAEVRDSDLFALLNNATVVRKTQDNPSEKRFRWMSSFDLHHNPKVSWNLSFGYERVYGFNFVPGRNINNFLVGLKMTMRPWQKSYF